MLQDLTQQFARLLAGGRGKASWLAGTLPGTAEGNGRRPGATPGTSDNDQAEELRRALTVNDKNAAKALAPIDIEKGRTC